MSLQNENGSPGNEANPHESVVTHQQSSTLKKSVNLKESDSLKKSWPAPVAEGNGEADVSDLSDTSYKTGKASPLVSICRTKPADPTEPGVLGSYSLQWCVDYIRSNRNAKVTSERLRPLISQGKEN